MIFGRIEAASATPSARPISPASGDRDEPPARTGSTKAHHHAMHLLIEMKLWHTEDVQPVLTT
jgi:hypothetical protein